MQKQDLTPKNGIDGKDGKDGVNGINGIDGRDGRDGIDGINGIDGKDGKDGKDGLDGKDGERGKQGIQGIKGDKGGQGEVGKDGLNGTDGENGKQGKKGLSAYAIAVKNGFKGDEERWLRSLKGKNGENGMSVVGGGGRGKLQPNDNFQFVDSIYDLPYFDTNTILLKDNVTYFICSDIDLVGARIICGQNTTIIGGSSENCRLKSTGLSGSTALITSEWSLPIRNITIEHGTAISLDATANANQALDWFGVNFTDCAIIGTAKNYSNFVMNDSAFLNSQGLTFDGSFGTIAFGNTLFDNRSTGTLITLPATLTITRRFRIIYSSFVCLSGETGINVNASATIPEEKYILDTVNFSGGGTYLTGVTDTSNKALFVACVGITNTNVNGQLYMQNNATVTTVASANVFYKVLGTTTASADNQKYLHSNNRLTNDAIIPRKFLIQCNLSFTSGSNNVCEFGFYDSLLATVRTPSKTKSTANGSGRAESVTFNCVVTHKQGDYLEIRTANTTGANNITVTDMNFVITEIK